MNDQLCIRGDYRFGVVLAGVMFFLCTVSLVVFKTNLLSSALSPNILLGCAIFFAVGGFAACVASLSLYCTTAKIDGYEMSYREGFSSEVSIILSRVKILRYEMRGWGRHSRACLLFLGPGKDADNETALLNVDAVFAQADLLKLFAVIQRAGVWIDQSVRERYSF